MRTLGAFSVLLALLFIAFVLAIGQPPQRPGGDKPGEGQREQRGRQSDVFRSELRRFSRPRPNPPPTQPPRHRDGNHHWRWHQHHGWILFPVTVSPTVVVLPPTYALPDRVTYYEFDVDCQFLCPHCGQLIQVDVK